MEKKFESLDELEKEVLRRRAEGHELFKSDDPKARKLGYHDFSSSSEGEYLWVPISSLSGEQLRALQASPDETLQGLFFQEGLELDMGEKAEELAEGQRASATDPRGGSGSPSRPAPATPQTALGQAEENRKSRKQSLEELVSAVSCDDLHSRVG